MVCACRTCRTLFAADVCAPASGGSRFLDFGCAAKWGSERRHSNTNGIVHSDGINTSVFAVGMAVAAGECSQEQRQRCRRK